MGSGLPQAPSRLLGFDGVDDFVSINNSQNVGSPYDFEYTTPFSFALTFMYYEKNKQYKGLIGKESGKGISFYVNNFGSTLQLQMYSTGQINLYMAPYSGLQPQTLYAIIMTYTGSGGASGVTFYVKDITNNQARLKGNSVTGGGVSVAGDNLSASIINTGQLQFGKTQGAFLANENLGKMSAWNTLFNDTQADELLDKMISNTVPTHSLYASNCVGYWREFVVNKAINAVNPTYDGTLNNF